MENKQQTAVEWLYRWVNDNPEATHEDAVLFRNFPEDAQGIQSESSWFDHE